MTGSSEGTAPKTDQRRSWFSAAHPGRTGRHLRARLRKKKMLKLKVRHTVGKAYSDGRKKADARGGAQGALAAHLSCADACAQCRDARRRDEDV